MSEIPDVCPACATKRMHTKDEWAKYHPHAGEGFSAEHGTPGSVLIWSLAYGWIAAALLFLTISNSPSMLKVPTSIVTEDILNAYPRNGDLSASAWDFGKNRRSTKWMPCDLSHAVMVFPASELLTMSFLASGNIPQNDFHVSTDTEDGPYERLEAGAIVVTVVLVFVFACAFPFVYWKYCRTKSVARH